MEVTCENGSLFVLEGEHMRKQGKKLALDIVGILHQTHEKIKKAIEQKEIVYAQNMLSECQNGIIQLGNSIEETEGEGFVTVKYIEEYCERLYQYFEELGKEQDGNANKIYKVLRKQLLQIESSIKNDIPVKLEMVFLPYKASMWDSMESVWKAAVADENCDAYVIPIPYYDKNPDGSFRQEHWEGEQYPADVPITRFDQYDFEKRKPDVVFIHNPYDECNTVTSVHPFFYSSSLKKFTEKLVYIPYFATAGGMSEGQALCPAYIHADYIVIQSEKFRRYYDARIPNEKFLAFGSPKFDSVIHKCQNPPEPAEEWKEKAKGKKVYFYNTSIAGMLGHTENFLKKMEYVFNTFQGREDACLLWRPHPLLESTFDSMRKQYKPFYEILKKRFVEENIGILDTTPDIESTIAFCDAYIGDSGTSVTSLFGVVGKPMFILNNNIHALPEEDDWRGEILKGFYLDGHNQWYVTQGNKLYYAPNNDFHYEYFCDLSEYAGGSYYSRAIEFEDTVYVCPQNAQDILIVSKDKSIKKMKLNKHMEQQGAFTCAWQIGEYLFILPRQYPMMIRFNMRTEEAHYISGVKEVYVDIIGGEKRVGGSNVWNNKLLFATPNGKKLFMMEANTLETKAIDTNLEGGILAIKPDKDRIWLLPYEGTVIGCWDAKTGEVKKYDAMVEGLECTHRPSGAKCNLRPFGLPILYDKQIILPPYWGNKMVCMNLENGIAEEYKLLISMQAEQESGYAPVWSNGCFLCQIGDSVFRYYSQANRKMYDIDVMTRECTEVEIAFKKDELCRHEAGFAETSQWMQYCCYENAFNSLKDFLDNNITGASYDEKKQIEAFSKINASINGDCGEKVYRFVMENV